MPALVRFPKVEQGSRVVDEGSRPGSLRDVEAAPWFKVFNGERINDHHTTLADKRATGQEATGKSPGGGPREPPTLPLRGPTA